MWKFYKRPQPVIETSSFWWAQLSRSTLPHPPEDGDRSSLRNVLVFCKTSTYQTMDRVQKKPNSSVQHTPSSESFQVYQDICCIMRAVYTTIFVKKQTGHYCINVCFILVLMLHVSALILGHHQAYNDTSFSSWIARNFNMDPYCIHVSFKCIN
jgi:hypothetical protein